VTGNEGVVLAGTADLQGLLKVFNCRFGFPLRRQGIAQIIMGIGISRGDLQGLLKVFNGRFGLSL
jgi:hypothetical protein